MKQKAKTALLVIALCLFAACVIFWGALEAFFAWAMWAVS